MAGKRGQTKYNAMPPMIRRVAAHILRVQAKPSFSRVVLKMKGKMRPPVPAPLNAIPFARPRLLVNHWGIYVMEGAAFYSIGQCGGLRRGK
jgi:hypothetical protein